MILSRNRELRVGGRAENEPATLKGIQFMYKIFEEFCNNLTSVFKKFK